MNESSARAVVLLQAFESLQPESPIWTADDRSWATRLATGGSSPDGSGGASSDGSSDGSRDGSSDGSADDPADAERFVVQRAEHAVQRLAPRDPAVAPLLAGRPWRASWLVWAALIGGIAGLVADHIGSSQRINLLAPPLWTVLAWNVVVYALLVVHLLMTHLLSAPKRRSHRPPRPGAITRWAARLLDLGSDLLRSGHRTSSVEARVAPAFDRLWRRQSAPIASLRATALLHAAAAALGLGLIAGLYLRGLVLDYRVAWESTFLDSAAARTLLGVVFAPAAAVSHIALPDAAALNALRSAHGDGSTGASAAVWIHLLAWTLLLVVVLPRGLLTAFGVWRAGWLARHMALPGDPYFQGLVRARRGQAAQVLVLPYAQAPAPDAAAAFTGLLSRSLGADLQLRVAPTVAFGDEDNAPIEIGPEATLVIALFDLRATPEVDNQGRFVRRLAALAAAAQGLLVLVDEAAFKARFVGDTVRLGQRRAAWADFADALGTPLVCIDVAASVSGLSSMSAMSASASRALQAAVQQSTQRGPA